VSGLLGEKAPTDEAYKKLLDTVQALENAELAVGSQRLRQLVASGSGSW